MVLRLPGLFEAARSELRHTSVLPRPSPNPYHFEVPIQILESLDHNNTLMFVQVYATTTTSDDDEIEELCDELVSTLIVKSLVRF